MPDDGVEVVISDSATDDADIRMKGKHEVTAEFAARDANIADYTDKTAARYKNSVHMSPDLLQFSKKRFVILNVTKLVGILIVSLKIPVGR
jgi:hypothetical protein